MNLPTIIVFSIITVIVVLIVIKGIIDLKNGKTSCSCGGSCGACGMNCHERKDGKTD